MDRGEDCPSLLVVDDDLAFCRTLKRVMERRGFTVTIAHSVAQALGVAQESPPEFVVLDLKMPGPSGLTLIERLKQIDPETRIVVLTGYASIATAIEAIKLGALHYLAKPATADDILAAFQRNQGDPDTPVKPDPISVERLEWEHIQRVLAESSGNISLTARKLKMHRRTLQRKLTKRPAHE